MYVVIVGCGRVGSELARLLSSEGHNVVIVDKNPKSFERLGGVFNGLSIEGNGYEIEVLKKAGIEKADAFCAVTNGDNTNLVAAQAAKKIFKVPKVIARVYDPQRAHIYKALGLDILSGTILFAAMIRDKLIESRFSSYLIESADVGILEFEIKPDLAGKKVSEINIPYEMLICSVIKKKGTIIPTDNTVLQEGDVLLAIVKTESLDKVKKKLGL
jgi:trk system potassium uptake protein TrkA